MARWKVAEQKLAEEFGTNRRPLSGGNSRSGGRDDADHEHLHLESKYGNFCKPLFNLYKDTAAIARKEKKTPVLGLREHNTHGCLVVFNTKHFQIVIREWLRANPKEAEEIYNSLEEE